MSFLNKFQYHYHTKYLDELSNSENYLELLSYLEKLSNEKKIFHDLSFKYVNNAIHSLSDDVSNKKIVWINSFLSEDKKYVLSFLESYLSNFNPLKQTIKSYQDEINKILLKSEKIDLNTLINHSYFFQWMIINKQKSPYKFISNNLPFFSTEKNFNFSKSNITQAYIYIINHPYQVYKFLKRDNNNDQEIARNIFLNLDHRASLEEHNGSSFYLSKKGWHTNIQSWTDANVINSLKGKIISKKELHNNSYEVLSSIILHLIQSGVKIDLNYDLIDDFVKKNSLTQYDLDDEISSKEKKFLDKYVNDIIENYDPL
tara:strand:+ start:302 stop:1246 length:945 start_codon:yes stop_codon:yes gene_type:complete